MSLTSRCRSSCYFSIFFITSLSQLPGLETREASTEDRSQLICGVRAAVVILLLTGITVYFLWKKKKYQTAEGSADPRTMKCQENSVVMVEMRSSAAEV